MRGFIPEGSFDGGLEAIGEVTGEPSFVAEPHPKDYSDKRQDQNKVLSLHAHLATFLQILTGYSG